MRLRLINTIVTKMFESLDFVYVPAPNIQESIRYYTKVFDGELLWKIYACGVWVACIKLSDKQPYILLADHIARKDLKMIYRVSNLEKVASALRAKGWREEKSLEIPNCPCLTFRDPAENSIVIYENRRQHVMSDFKGGIDNDP
jgi:hypothetical protein